ncbi:MAG: TMEM165/GDT1 family protein [Candidatus Thorarchaeota archaeon]|nr:MAG: TMEM165/GDT1 family protein [Candidatus Thorarchaeota archaeon]
MPIQTLISSAGLVLLMELGDKTMLTTICLSAQYRRPWLVLLATMVALATSSVIAVIIGYILSATLPIEIITYVSGILFIVLGIYTLATSNSDIPDTCDNPGTMFGMFSLVLLSELGDKSQITILALAAQTPFAIMVFAGSLIGFLVVNAIGAFAGNRVAARIPLKIVKKVVGLIFVLFGGLIVLGIL